MIDSNQKLEELKLLWEEYKYRHDLVWRVIFQLTAAIVILSVIPYVSKDVAQVLKWGILSLPLLSLALTVLGFFLIRNELDLFYGIKNDFRDRQGELFPNIKHESGADVFRGLVTFYFISLLVLTLINFFLILLVWIPKIC